MLDSIVNPAVMLCSVLHFVKTLFTNFLWKKILLSDLHHLRLKHSRLYLLSAKLEQFEPVSPSSKGDGSGYKIFIFSIRLCLQSLIKKKNLDPADLSNYRPISKLSFLSKVLEKVVLNQIN